MIKKLLFSIIIPIYNSERYLDICLRSIEYQSYHDFEVIMVDDGSTDGSAEICKLYQRKDERFKYFYKENNGSTSARKFATSKLSGEFVVCVDSDDWLEEDYLRKIRNVLKNEKIDIVRTFWSISYRNKNISQRSFLREGYYDSDQIIQEVYPFLIESENGWSVPKSLCAMAVRKSIFCVCQNVIDDVVTMGEDQLVMILCTLKAKAYYVLATDGYMYRQRKSSIINNTSVDILDKRWDSCKYSYDLLRKINDESSYDFEDQINRLMIHKLFISGELEYRRKDAYWVIRKDITKQFDNHNYKMIAQNCRYKNYFPGTMARICVLYNWTFPMYLRNRLKRLKILFGKYYD